jgi:precorrin-3B C17-methyltransferase
MLTTVVIGNRHTRWKRTFIFTPRGYGAWEEKVAHLPSAMAPPPQTQKAVWVFSGTSDGNAVAGALAAAGIPVLISTATEYGGEVAGSACADIQVRAGRQGMAARRSDLKASAAQGIVDATHPYATEISVQLMALAKELGLPYVRFERDAGAGDYPMERHVSLAAAAARAIEIGRRIFLATGSKGLTVFLDAEGAAARAWFLRLTPDPERIQRALALKVPRSHLCAMQGPFSKEMNMALWRDWQIDCVVSKDSGAAGGVPAKAAAAAALGIPFLVVERPRLVYPAVASSVEEVVLRLRALKILGAGGAMP